MSPLSAFYELNGTHVELPIVGLTDVFTDGPRRLLVLNPETGEVHPFGEDIPYVGSLLTAGYVRPVRPPVPADGLWLAEVWTVGCDATYIGTFPVLAWEPGDQTDPDVAPGGDAVVLITEPTEHAEPGPVSTRLLPGLARYRRADQPPLGPLALPEDHEWEQ